MPTDITTERVDTIIDRIAQNPPRDLIAVQVNEIQASCRDAAETLADWLDGELVELLERVGAYEVRL